MKRIKRILLAIDGTYDRQAFIDAAATVATDTEAEVTVLRVFDSPPDAPGGSAESADLKQWISEDNLSHLNEVASEFAKRDIQVTTKQSSGKPYLEIIREALRGDYDLIMKPAERKATVKSILFGGTDMQLFRMCPCPIWVFKPTLSGELSSIMVAVDLLEHDQEKSILADHVLNWGKHIANLVDAELHVIHAWSLYGEMTLRSRSVLSERVDQLVRDEEEKQRLLLNDALARNGIEQDEIRIHFCKGEAKKLIPERASEMAVDLLIMGTVGRSGIPGFFIGNTAEAVLRQVDCSVLAIKPEEFSTPVEVD